MAKQKVDPNLIRFKCGRCQANLKVPIAQAGRFIECPKCKQRTPVPLNQAEADDEGTPYTVIEHAYDVPEKCMKCGKKLKKGTILCVNCGFDYRKGQQLTIEDHTVREGEKRRGGPALKAGIAESVVLVASIIGFIVYYVMNEGAPWWYTGLQIGGSLFMLALIVRHLMMWNDYRGIPIRPSPTTQTEDRAERQEVAEPFGSYTAPLFILLVGGAVGIAWYVGGREATPEASPPPAPSAPAPAP